MTLSDAIEWVMEAHDGTDYTKEEFVDTRTDTRRATAIATILNAVVKGELK